MRPLAILLAALLAGALFVGCTGKPNAANIELRKQNQKLADQLAHLESRHRGDQSLIATLQDAKGSPPLVPTTRLSQLFTAHGLTLQRMTGPADFDPAQPGDDGLKIFACPSDDTGDQIKTAGSFVIELFDLSADQPRLGRWEFSVEQARDKWNGQFLQYNYVLECPWQTRPTRSDLLIKVTFTDLLSGRLIEAEKKVRYTPQPTTQPTTQSAAR